MLVHLVSKVLILLVAMQ